MQNVIKSLIAIVGVTVLGIGIASAGPSSDCGDDDVQPINIHSASKAISKES